jgi:hypothetical protein
VYTKPTEPRSIGGVLDDGLRLWRDSLGKTWPLALLAQLVVAIPFLLLGFKLQGAVPMVPGVAPRPMSAANAQAMLNLFKSPATWLTYLSIVVLSAVLYTALVLRIAAVANGAASSLGSALSSALRLLPRLLLQFLLFFAAAIVVGIVLALLAAAGSKAVLGLVFIVVFFVGVFVFGRIFFASMVLMLDDAGAAQSIAISWRLTRGYWWRCTAILLVLFVIGLVFSLVVGFISAALGGALGTSSLLATGITQLMSLLVNAVLGSLFPAVVLGILYDLKLRKQGGDLLGRVDALARQ